MEIEPQRLVAPAVHVDMVARRILDKSHFGASEEGLLRLLLRHEPGRIGREGVGRQEAAVGQVGKRILLIQLGDQIQQHASLLHDFLHLPVVPRPDLHLLLGQLEPQGLQASPLLKPSPKGVRELFVIPVQNLSDLFLRDPGKLLALALLLAVLVERPQDGFEDGAAPLGHLHADRLEVDGVVFGQQVSEVRVERVVQLLEDERVDLPSKDAPVLDREDRRLDLPRDHVTRMVEEVGVVSAREREGVDQGHPLFAPGPPAALGIVRRPRRDVAHEHRGQVPDVHAHLHGRRADQHVGSLLFERALDLYAPRAAQLGRVFTGDHAIGLA